MNRRRHRLAPVALLLLTAAWALPLPEAPVGDEATYLLAAASVWHDGDLRYGPEDLVRGYEAWGGGPRGLALAEDGGALVYARPFLYPVLAAPAYGLLGPRGLRVLGMALLLAVLAAARQRLLFARPAAEGCGMAGAETRRGSAGPPVRPTRGGLLLVAGFLFASAAAVWALRLDPAALVMACAFFAVALWCRVRSEPLWGRRELLPLAGSGALLAVAVLHEPLLGVLALPVAVDLLWCRRVKAAAVFVLALLAAGLALGGLQERAAGAWGPELLRAGRTYAGPFPFEARPAVEEPAGSAALLAGSTLGEEAGVEPAAGPGLLGRRLLWLLAGRHLGLLPYFPFALFVAGLYLADLRRRGGRSRHLLAGALVLGGVLALLGGGGVGSWAEAVAPGAAGAAAPGPRAFALVYPVLLFLPGRLRGGRALLLPFAAAGLWLAPALAVAASGTSPGYLLELPARGPTYRVLPLELELLADGRLPGYQVLDRFPEGQGGPWLVPRETFFASERHPDGVWVRGGSRSEVFLVAREPVEAVRFTATSLAAASALVVRGDGRLRARFDTEGKRGGVPVEVRPELVARGLGLFLHEAPEDERIYRLVIEVTGGAVPASIDPGSGDPRYLGVFLEF